MFQVPGLIVVPLVFYYAATHSLELTKWGMFFAGVFTVGQLSFWGNYLPRVYPTHLRGTGEGFAANIGGRMLGTGFAFVTTQLVDYMPGATPPMHLAYASALVAASSTPPDSPAASFFRNHKAKRSQNSPSAPSKVGRQECQPPKRRLAIFRITPRRAHQAAIGMAGTLLQHVTKFVRDRAREQPRERHGMAIGLRRDVVCKHPRRSRAFLGPRGDAEHRIETTAQRAVAATHDDQPDGDVRAAVGRRIDPCDIDAGVTKHHLRLCLGVMEDVWRDI